MRNEELEEFLSQVAAQLALSGPNAEPIVAELRAHLYADYEERLAGGCNPQSAAREAIREVGDARALAREFERETPTRDQRLVLRTIAALAIAVYGFFGAYALCDYQVLMHATERLLPRNSNGALLVTGWAGHLWTAAEWLREHSQVEGFVCGLPPLVVVGIAVGYVARRRGWLPATVPALLFWLLTWQAVVRGKFPFAPYDHIALPLGQFLALGLGAWLGEGLSRSRLRARRFLVAGSVLALVLVCLAGLAEFNEGLLISSAVISGYAVVVGLVGGLAVWLVRRLSRRIDTLTTN
jgi:hypothetical protein